MRLRRRFVKDEFTKAEAIKKLREEVPKQIAEQLASIQPMSGTGDIFKIGREDTVGDWKKKFTFWPKKSINDKWIFGRINERGHWKWSQEVISGENYTTHQVHTIEYATDKEIFKGKLKGDE